MAAARESRPSEKIMSEIWSMIPHLIVCVWHPLSNDAIEYAQDIQIKLVRLIDQLQKEKNEEFSKQMKSTNFIKTKDNGNL